MKELKPNHNIVRIGRAESHTVVSLNAKQITLRGHVSDVEYERTFHVGEIVEFDGDYAGSRYGKLERIYKDAVVVNENDEMHQLSLYEFAAQNWNFNLEKALYAAL